MPIWLDKGRQSAVMRATILTILPHPSERHVQVRSAPTGETSLPQTQGLVPSTSASGQTMPSIESVILHKLLSELQAREVAGVSQPYRVETPSPAQHIALLRTLWLSLWALSIVLCVFVVKYLDSEQTASTIDTAQARSIDKVAATLGLQKIQFSNMIVSIQGLAGVIASTSAHTARIPAMLQRLASDLRQTASLPLSEAGEQMLPTIVSPSYRDASAGISMGGHHHPLMEDLIAPSDVVVHHNSLGVMDYWLVPRLVSGVWTMTKAVPIAESSTGIFVHAIADVKDYMVTPSRDWIAASEANDNH